MSKTDNKLRIDLSMLFLMEAFLIIGIHNLHHGKDTFTVGVPVAVYIAGKAIMLLYSKCRKKYFFIGIVAAALVQAIIGLALYRYNKNTDWVVFGFYKTPFKDGFYENALIIYWFLAVFAVIVAIGWYFLENRKWTSERIKKIILALASTVIVCMLLFWYIRDIRFTALKEAACQLYNNPWGGLSLTTYDTNTSHNMWFDYGRDYGWFPFVFIMAFLIASISDTVRLSLKRRDMMDYLLISIFIFLNLFYWTESIAVNFILMWYLGIFVSGLIRGKLELKNCKR